MRTTKATIALAATALLGAGLLSGCSQDSVAIDNCEAPFSGGALSENVTVLGGFGTEPVVSMPEDVTFGNAQMSYIEKASDRSETITEDSVVTVNYALIESATGEVIEQSESFTSGQGLDIVQVSPSVEQNVFPGGLKCAAPGDRLILTLSPEEAEAFAGSFGAPSGTALAVLVDVHGVQPLKSTGKTRSLPSGFPGVVTDDSGQPGVVANPVNAPTEVKSASRIVGEGPEISAESGLVGNVLEVSWDGSLAKNTFAEGPEWIGSEVEPGSPVREFLTGKTVGSQVIIVMPDESGSATTFVVDILAAV